MKTTNIDYIKELELSDVINLRRRSFLAVAPEYYNPQEVENLIADYDVVQFASMIENQSFFCIRNGNKIVATAGWDSARIRHVYVSPDIFKSGIGSKLVNHVVVDFFSRTTQDEIKAGVVVYAQGFYEKCGFNVLSEETAWDGSAYYLMTRSRPIK